MAKKLKVFLSAVIAVFAFCGISLTFANTAKAEDNVINIQVSPTKTKISLAPGSSYSGTYKVQNVGTGPFSYTAYATPYSVTSDNYDPDYNSTTAHSQMASWITFDDMTAKGTLQPGETVEVKYTVNVPQDVPAGAQYAALMAQTDSGKDDNATVNVVHRVGMILYAAVPGETRETGEVVKNTVNNFYFNPPLTVSSLVKNTGNVEQTAKYTVKIYPLFSNESVFNTENEAEGDYNRDIMPDTSRFNSISWENAPSIGIFSVEQTIEFAGETSTVSKLVLICPLWLLFVVFALIFFIIFWIISRARERKNGKSSATTDSSSKTEKSSKESKTSKEEK